MKLAILTALLSANFASAGQVQSCEMQGECFSITMEKVASDACYDGECEYEICLTTDFGGSCSAGTFSHTCVKDDDVCSDGGGFEGSSRMVEHVESGYTQCQIVPPDGLAEFLIKDGNANRVGGCGSASKIFDGVTATCGTLGVRSCAGKAMIDKECVWKFRAPESCGSYAGGGGDPHIKKWDGERFSYHGECDLMLLHSDDFEENASLELQIRTTIVDFYSYVEAAALRIGDSIMEITMGHIWIDGVEITDEALPAQISGYTLLAPVAEENAIVYRVDLGDGDKIGFRLYKHFLTVDIFGNQERFENSYGLMGDYNSGAMVGRDGKIFEVHEAEEYGLQWQVGAEEKMLFRESREPQLPHAQCIMPSATARHRRTTAAEASAAKAACSHKRPEDFEFCVTDVLATGDVGMAGVW